MLSVEQCRAGRALLGWSAEALAKAAGLGVVTVRRFEGGQAVASASVDQMADALVGGGVTILADGEASGHGGPGVRLTGHP